MSEEPQELFMPQVPVHILPAQQPKVIQLVPSFDDLAQTYAVQQAQQTFFNIQQAYQA